MCLLLSKLFILYKRKHCMKWILVALTFLLLLGCVPAADQPADVQPQVIQEVMPMKLTSTAFPNDGKMDSKYTCDGVDINPQLSLSDVPDGAQSLVLIMDDPDAVKPAGKVWDHWIVFNIPPDTTDIPEGQEPSGIQGKGTSGNLKYHGPCPPDAEHQYVFKLYALDSTLDLAEGATKADVEAAMNGHVLAEAQLLGRYERK